MIILKPVSRRWFLGGIIAGPAIVAVSNIMPVRAMEWIGQRWEGTAGDFAWRAAEPTYVIHKTHPRMVAIGWAEETRVETVGGLELRHRADLDPAEWVRACRQGSRGELNGNVDGLDRIHLNDAPHDAFPRDLRAQIPEYRQRDRRVATIIGTI